MKESALKPPLRAASALELEATVLVLSVVLSCSPEHTVLALLLEGGAQVIPGPKLCWSGPRKALLTERPWGLEAGLCETRMGVDRGVT